MKKILPLIICLTLQLSPPASGQELSEFLKQAAESNPGIQAKYHEFESAMQRIAQVKSLPDPTLSVALIARSVETRVGPQQARFTLTQMFPWFGTLKAKGESAALEAESKFYEYLDARNKLFLEVKTQYYLFAELDQKIKLQEENIQILNTYKTISTSAFENNKGSLADILRIDLMIESSQTEIEILKKEREPILRNMGSLLNSDEVEFEINDSLKAIDIVDNYRLDSLVQNHPLLNSLESKAAASRSQGTAARLDGMPKMEIGLDYVIIGERTDMNVPDNGKNAFMPMVSISLPIYRKKYRAAINEAHLKEESILMSKKATIRVLESEYFAETFELKKAGDLIELYTKQILQAEQIRKLLMIEYSNSGQNFLEILRIQQEVLAYELNRVSAAKDFYLAFARLDYLTHNEQL